MNDTTLEVKPEVVEAPPAVINMEYDTPPKEWVAGTVVPKDTLPEDMTNAEWIQWAYDNLMPFWAIKRGLLERTPPTITALEPSTAVIGDPGFTLYVSGTNFHAGVSVIVFAGQDENTTLNEDGRLQTGVNMGVWHGPDTVKVAVRNGAGGAMSDEMDFVFTAPAGGTRKEFADYPPVHDEHEHEHDYEEEPDDDGKPVRKSKKKK